MVEAGLAPDTQPLTFTLEQHASTPVAKTQKLQKQIQTFFLQIKNGTACALPQSIFKEKAFIFVCVIFVCKTYFVKTKCKTNVVKQCL